MIVNISKKMEAKYLKIDVAVRYGDEDMPYDFPLRDGDRWRATIDLDSHEILEWNKGTSGSFSDMKVCDEGTYELIDEDNQSIIKLEETYVPNELLPGDYGDYLSLEINDEGIIENWLSYANLSDFEGGN